MNGLILIGFMSSLGIAGIALWVLAQIAKKWVDDMNSK